MTRSPTGELRCSFCGKSQDIVGKLISSPSDYPRAYICDECVGRSTPEDQRAPLALEQSGARPSHCLMCHPRALELLAAIERWVLAISERRDPHPELAEMRRMARSMMGLDPE